MYIAELTPSPHGP